MPSTARSIGVGSHQVVPSVRRLVSQLLPVSAFTREDRRVSAVMWVAAVMQGFAQAQVINTLPFVRLSLEVTEGQMSSLLAIARLGAFLAFPFTLRGQIRPSRPLPDRLCHPDGGERRHRPRLPARRVCRSPGAGPDGHHRGRRPRHRPHRRAACPHRSGHMVCRSMGRVPSRRRDRPRSSYPSLGSGTSRGGCSSPPAPSGC